MTYDLISKCEELMSNLTDNNVSIREAVEFLQSKEVIKTINRYVNSEYINRPITEYDIQIISEIIKIAQFIYNYSGSDTGISDSDYDKLYEIMVNGGGDDIISVSPSTIVETCHHKFPSFRGTLDKVYSLGVGEESVNNSRRSLDQWISSAENLYYDNCGARIDLSKVEIYVFPKFDGVSCIFEMRSDSYEASRALTRGYTKDNTAQNVLNTFKKYKYIPVVDFGDEYAVKTEIMVKNSDLDSFNEKYGTNYKNTRSIASAILNSNEYDKEKSKLLHPVPLRVGSEEQQILCDEVFSEYPYLSTTMDDRIGIKRFADSLESLMSEYRCDGAVIYIVDAEIRNVLGRKDDKNKYEVAYKFTEVEAKTRITNVIFQMGDFGNIAPVAIVEPVKLKGNTISRVSLGSIGRMKSLNLSPNSEVIIKYDIIPYLTVNDKCTKSDDIPFAIPNLCPTCGKPLCNKKGSDELQCSNPSCESKILGKLVNFASKNRIKGLSYATLRTFINMDLIHDISDLYTLYKNKKFCHTAGFGKKRWSNILKSIDESREMYSDEFLGSLGIEGLSRKTARKILSVIPYYTIIDNMVDGNTTALYNMLICIEGIGSIMAENIIHGLKENLDLIEHFESLVSLGEFRIVDVQVQSYEPKFTVCFSRIRDNDTEKTIEAKEGLVVDNVNKDTTYLVVPSEAVHSSKITKARKHGVRIVTLDEFKEILMNM